MRGIQHQSPYCIVYVAITVSICTIDTGMKGASKIFIWRWACTVTKSPGLIDRERTGYFFISPPARGRYAVREGL